MVTRVEAKQSKRPLLAWLGMCWDGAGREVLPYPGCWVPSMGATWPEWPVGTPGAQPPCSHRTVNVGKGLLIKSNQQPITTIATKLSLNVGRDGGDHEEHARLLAP